MAISGMNHFTVLTDDVPATVGFYCDLLGLADGPRPPLGFPGAWLYTGGQAVLHIVGGRPKSELRAGVIDHMAFSASRAPRHHRQARCEGPPVPVPAAGGLGRVAGLRARSERRPCRARLRAGRAGAAMSGGSAPAAAFDHLVVAAATLADGIEYVAAATGATPRPGGKHVAMGTHNALLRLSERTFLEVIAIDPEGSRPARPRWFELDDIALQAELTERPRLIHWVARTTGHRARRRGVPDPARRRASDGARRLSLAHHDSRRRVASRQRNRPHADRVGRAAPSGGIAAELGRHAGQPRRRASRARGNSHGTRGARARRHRCR